MAAFKLAIFDCDGVLVDSERITCQILSECLAEKGIVMDWREALHLFIGKTTATIKNMLGERSAQKLPEYFWTDFVNRTHTALAEQVEPVRHIETTLKQLDIPFCVASNGQLSKMRTTLGKTGLLGHFEGKMFSAEQVAQGKPAPDLFLLAAKTLGFRPEECVVVEDSPTGIQAAVAAGMTPFGYTEYTPQELLLAAGAVCVFPDMSHLPDLIRQYPHAAAGGNP